MKLPPNVVNHLKQLPVFSAILWQANNIEQPIVVVKMPPDTNFASYAIGFGSVDMQSITSDDATIRLTFLLQDTSKQKKVSWHRVPCSLNPFSQQDRKIGVVLAGANTLIVVAIARKSSVFLGAKQLNWPSTKGQQLSRLLALAQAYPHHLYTIVKSRTYFGGEFLFHIAENESTTKKSNLLPSLTPQKRNENVSLPHTSISISSSHPLAQSLVKKDDDIQKQEAKARTYTLTANLLDAIAMRLAHKPLPELQFPKEESLLIETVNPIHGYVQEAYAFSLFSRVNEQSDLMPIEAKVMWNFHIMDKGGVPFLKLLYRPDLKKWDFAADHRCPNNKCLNVSLLMQTLVIQPQQYNNLFHLPCQSCQWEAAFWEKCLPSILTVVYGQVDNEVSPPDKLLAAEVTQIPSSQSSTRNEQNVFTLTETARRVLTPLPTLTGILFSANELCYPRPPFQDESLLLVKVPATTYPFHRCVLTFQSVQRFDLRPKGTVICLNLMLRSKELVESPVSCLCILSVQDDCTILKKVVDNKANKVRIVAISDNEFLTVLGMKSLSYPLHIQEQLKTASTNFLFEKQKRKSDIRTQWFNEFYAREPVKDDMQTQQRAYQQVPSLAQPTMTPSRIQVPPPLTPLKSLSTNQPKTLREVYAAELHRRWQQYDKASSLLASVKQQKLDTISIELEDLQQAYACEVKDSALQMLVKLLRRQKQLPIGELFQLPASHLWLEFESPIASFYGTTTIDVRAIWLQQSLPPSRQWICTILGENAEKIKCTYLYTSGKISALSLAKDYQCPDQQCQQTLLPDGTATQLLCFGCRQGLNFWATALHLLLKMLQGDYAVREDAHKPTTLSQQIIVEPFYSEPSLGKSYVMKYIDATIHKVQSHSNSVVSRIFWLQALSAFHPELIETTHVLIRQHLRRINSSNKTTLVSSHRRTVYRRKDRIRRTKLIAEMYNERRKNSRPE